MARLTQYVLVVLCVGCSATVCTGDGVCPEASAVEVDEADAMKISLLQKRASEGAQQAALASRRVELLEELAALEEEISAEEGREVIEEEISAEEGLESLEVDISVEKGREGVDDQDLVNVNGTWGTGGCASYSCGSYKRGRNCQCNGGCAKYNSCCDDFKAVCNTCVGACNRYIRDKECQCTSQCTTYGNCCDDYQSACGGGSGPRPHPTPPPTQGPAPTPPAPTPPSPSGGGGGAVKGVFGHPSASIDYPKYEGFTLWLAEEFEQPIDLDKDPIWTWSDGGLREGEVRFAKENIRFEGGKMKIYVTKDHPASTKVRCSAGQKEDVSYKPLTSGEMRSKYNWFRYGIYEASIKAPEIQPGNPNINGNFMATLFVYRDANAHHWREIDIEISGEATNSLTTNVFRADGTKNWRADLADSKHISLGNINVRKDFHTYMFKWTPSGVSWSVDGKVVRGSTRFPSPEFSTKVYMNLWIFTGGAVGGRNVANNRYPFWSEYEYFRFYKYDGEKTYPCPNMDLSCLTEDDHYLAKNNPCDGIKNVGLLEGRKVCDPGPQSFCPVR